MSTQTDKSVFSDFDELANWFVELGSHFSPSESHGALCGALSGGMRLEDTEWSGFLWAVMGLETGRFAPEELSNHGRTSASFVAEQLDLLATNELTFQLFLPDDDTPIEQRTAALGQWCRGFLGGFAEAQLHRSRVGNAVPASYPENVEESIKDLTEIAKATYQASSPQEEPDYAEDSEDISDESTGSGPGHESGVEDFDPLMQSEESFMEAQASEFDERDFVEVSEYVRLAALTIFTEFGWVEVLEARDTKKSGPTDRGRTLH